MDLLIPLVVLLLVVAVVALLLAKQAKARQAERTARQYGAKSTHDATYQPTYEDPAVRPADAEIQEAMEAMAGNLAELLKKKGAGKGTFETTVTTTTTSTSHPLTTTTTHHAGPGTSGPASAAGPAGTHYTERSISLTEQTAERVKALALAGQREEAVAVLTSETGMDGQGADMMVDMILEQS